jgi:hypothetical protein
MAWNRRGYLSAFERRLNRVLTAAVVVALVGAALQHVFLAKVPEVVPMGAEWGELLYDLAIGYVGAFIVYVLLVRIPLRRDRRNYYSHLGPLIVRLVAEANDLVVSLNRAAGLETEVLTTARPNTQANIREMLGMLTPASAADHVVFTANGIRDGTVADVVTFHVHRARAIIGEILAFAPNYDSEVIELVVALRECQLFQTFELREPSWRIGGGPDVASLEKPLFNYLLLADRLNRYRDSNNIVGKPTTYPELINTYTSYSGEDSTAVPLSGEIPSPPLRIRLGTRTVDVGRSPNA